MTSLVAGSKRPSEILIRYAESAVEWNPSHAVTQFRYRDIEEALKQLIDASTPLKTLEPKLDGSLSKRIANPLRLAGLKINPSMSTDQCTAWLKAILAGISDLPPHIATKLADDTLHRAFRFIAEVDVHLRSEAPAYLDRHRALLHRIRAMKDEITRAARPPEPQIADRRTDPCTDEEVRALLAVPDSGHLIRIGLKLGSIDQAQLNRLREENKDAERE